MYAGIPPRADPTPPRADLRSRPPKSRPHGADTPREQMPPGVGTPREQTPWEADSGIQSTGSRYAFFSASCINGGIPD